MWYNMSRKKKECKNPEVDRYYLDETSAKFIP